MSRPDTINLAFDINAAGDDKSRFGGVAYSGGSVVLWGEQSVFDLSDLEHKDKIPALVNHDSNQRAGVIDSINVGTDIKINGFYLDSEKGNQIKSEAGSGFPWQMSVGIKPRSYERLESGSKTINGRLINAPALIYRNCQLVEVSFVPVGADTNTSAFNLSGLQQINEPPQAPQKIMEKQTPDESPEVARLRAELAAKDAEITRLNTEKRENQLAELKAALNFELNESEITALKQMPASQFELTTGMMQKMQSSNKKTAFLGVDLPLDDKSGTQKLSAGDLLIAKAKGYK